MHRKRVFTIAGVFLALALIVPPVIVVLSASNTIYKYIVPGVNPVQGSPTITISITAQERANYVNSLIVAGVVAVVFLALFIVTMYNGINHTHPEH